VPVCRGSNAHSAQHVKQPTLRLEAVGALEVAVPRDAHPRTACWRELNSNSQATSRALPPWQFFSRESKRPANGDSNAS
jgi:hypothetical protein